MMKNVRLLGAFFLALAPFLIFSCTTEIAPVPAIIIPPGSDTIKDSTIDQVPASIRNKMVVTYPPLFDNDTLEFTATSDVYYTVAGDVTTFELVGANPKEDGFTSANIIVASNVSGAKSFTPGAPGTQGLQEFKIIFRDPTDDGSMPELDITFDLSQRKESVVGLTKYGAVSEAIIGTINVIVAEQTAQKDMVISAGAIDLIRGADR